MNKRIKSLILPAFIACTLTMFSGCTDGFEEYNTNPRSLPTVDPSQELYTAEIQMLTSGHCWNSIYASKYRWLQYGAGIWGYNLTQYSYFMNSIGNSIYDEYINMGGYVTNMEYLAEQTGKPERYSHLNSAGRILLIAKGIQASDLFGSLAYSEGWLARKGLVDDESMTPKFETQEELVAIWDKQLKDCIEALSKSADQASFKGYDRVYNGDAKKWLKAANAIRLRIASRLWDRKPETARAIATEVLAASNAANVFGSNDDSFILWFDNLYTNIHSGDWHSVKDMEIATNCIMDYLNRNEDPRRRMFFVINNLTPENIAAFNAQQTDATRLLPVTLTRWEGSTASYDDFSNTEKNRTRLQYYLNPGSNQVDMRPANKPQVRLWKGNDTNGNGGNWAPVMTFSDFCLLASEFVLREHISSARTAQEWYETGVKASLDQWNAVGKFCDIENYAAMTETEIATFLAKPDIKWDEAKALEQIHAQFYVDHYKNVDEAYAYWRRTDYPNRQSSIVRFDTPMINSAAGTIPRKAKLTYPNDGVHNAANLKQRIDKMREDPDFGTPDNEYGRLWWDKKQ